MQKSSTSFNLFNYYYVDILISVIFTLLFDF